MNKSFRPVEDKALYFVRRDQVVHGKKYVLRMIQKELKEKEKETLADDLANAILKSALEVFGL